MGALVYLISLVYGKIRLIKRLMEQGVKSSQWGKSFPSLLYLAKENLHGITFGENH
ncbi:hypothetical protein HMPREF1557_00549 [Streptococcus sobrinus W1703]|uniref:Uncharacterized protein n=1 Tax=Streptococcus sobrinus W1703 TaxID=1227275 RepID=U2JCS7_9STRE|nr:hypothetical protein HMPREF1557_00549 [Streptococcus sobrinus W1703]